MRNGVLYPWTTICMLLFTATLAQAAVIDAPHNESYGITCGDCHSYSTWWQYSPGLQSSAPDYAAITSAICMGCHDTGSSLPVAAAHSAAVLGSNTYHNGGWAMGCTDCHNPHHQDQLNWVGTDTPYLLSGLIDSVAPGTETGTTDITYSGATSNADWPVAGWEAKNSSGRGLVLVQDTSEAANTFMIVAATDTVITVKGSLGTSMVDTGSCGSATCDTFGLIYGQLVKDQVNTPNSGSKDVKFFNNKGGFVDTVNFDGICQVCHTQTLHYRNDASAPGASHTGRDATNCVSCHSHESGFKGSGHDNTHFGWAPVGATNCAVCHIDGGNGVIGGIHASLCTTCHDAVGNLVSGDPVNGVDGDATGEKNQTYDSTCADCHDSTTKPVNTIPDAHHLASSNNFAVDGDCTQCHADETGKLAADHSAFVQDFVYDVGNNLSCGSASCHAGTVGLTSGAPVDPANGRVHDACTSCHETNGDLKAPTAIALAMPIGGGTCNDCHTDKVGAHIIDHVASGRVTLPTSGNCDTCHDATVDMDLFVDNSNNAVHDACETCHNTADYTLRTDLGRTLVAGDCTGCHSDKDDGTTLNLFAHKVEHAATDRVTLATDCSDCHATTIDSTVFVDGTDNKKHDFCSTCHVSATDLGLRTDTGRTLAAGDCTACHGDYFPNHPEIDHLTKVGLATECALCHTGTEGNAGGIPTDPNNNKIHDACTSCHASNGVLIGSAQGNTDPNLCTDCHGLYFDQHQNIDHSFIIISPECAACHSGTEGTATGMPVNPDNTKIHNACSTCHDGNGNLIGIAAGKTGEIGCVDCHGSDLAVIHPNMGHETKVSLATECSGCHSGTEGTANGIPVDPDNPKVHNACTSCHDSATNALTGSAEGNTDPNSCVDCHGSDLTLIHPNMGHATKVSMATECAGCHTGAEGDANSIPVDSTNNKLHNSCASCHDGVTNALISIAAGNLDPNNCGDCHGVSIFGVHSATVGSHAGQVDYTTDNTCERCHSGDVIDVIHKGNCGACHDTANSYVLQSLATAGPGDCQNCHGSDWLGLHPLTIDHETQVSLATECSGCHSGTEGAVDGIPLDGADNKVHDSCTTCHDAATGMLGGIAAGKTDPNDCTACHAAYFDQHQTIDHSSKVSLATECSGCHGGTEGNATGIPTDDANNKVHDSCYTCHDAATGGLTGSATGNTDPNSCTDCHGAYFPDHKTIDHASKVGLATECSGCHAGTEGNATGIPTDATNNKLHDACTTCHDETTGALTGIAAGNTDPNVCTDCHGDYFDQHQSISHSSKVSLATECSGCHTGTEGDATSIPVDSNDDKVHDACSSCHDSTGSLTGSAAGNTDPNSCADCHGTDIFVVHASTVGSHSGQVEYTTDNSCDRCHSGDVVGTVHVGNCGNCHDTADYYNLTSLATAGPGNCQNCHGSDWLGLHPATIDHATQVSLATECSGCHSGTEGSVDGIPLDGSDNKVHDSCSACHDGAGNLTGIAVGNTDPNSCADCHGAYFDQHQSISHTSKVSLSSECAGCHVGTEGNATGIPVDANNNKVHDSCSTCHDATGALTGIAAGNTDPNGCTDCHGADIQTIHPNIGHTSKVSLATECSGCHSGTEGNASGIPVDANNNKVHDSCSTCHASDGSLTGSAAGNTDPNSCTDCHGDYFPNHQTIGHATKVGANASCAACHTGTAGTADGIPTDANDSMVHDSCSSCHGADGSLIGIAAGNSDPNTCTDCHGAGSAAAHHSGSSARNGDCTACHADKRPWAEAPSQAACRECHINNNGYVMYKDMSGANPSHANNTAGDIQDFGACFACHTVEPYHGKPASLSTNNRCTNSSAVGRGTFNIFWSEFNMASDQGDRDCRSYENDYRYVPNNVDWATMTLNTGTFDVPHFDGQDVTMTTPSHASIQVASGCSDCHTVANIITSTHNNNCQACHFSDRQEVQDTITAAIGGSNVDCTWCHASVSGGHDPVASHDMLSADLSTCFTCHGGSGDTWDGIYTLHRSDCLTCHSSSSQAVQDTIDAGKAGTAVACSSCHGSGLGDAHHGGTQAKSGDCTFCHADRRPWADAPTQAACRECHINNNGYVMYKDMSGPNPTHANNTNGDIQDFGACFACHTVDPYHAKPASLSTNNRCTTSGAWGRGTFNIFWSEFNRASYENDENCKNYENDYRYVPNNVDMATLTLNTGTFDVPHFDGQDVTMSTPSHSRIQVASGCSDCHTVSNIITSTHNNNCQGCHFSSRQEVQDAVSAGIGGSTIDCTWCHVSSGGGHVPETDHDMLSSDLTTCFTCHGGSGDTWDDIYTLHRSDCLTCHSSSSQAVQGTIDAGKAGTAVACSSCHGSGLGDAHHGGTQAKSGDCTFCHADRRPWADAPTQAACRECHINNNGYVMYKDMSGPNPTHANNTNGDIQDFGACFACHTVDPYHAKPASLSTNNRCTTSGAWGRGTFNIFWSEFNRASYENDENCKNYENDYRYVPNNVDMATLTLNTGTFDVPHFDGQDVTMSTPSHSRIQVATGCSDCHTVSNIITSTHNNNCQGCHFSSRQEVQDAVSAGIGGSNIDCTWCHTTSGGGHDPATDHDMIGVSSSCTECHTTGTTWDDLYTLHLSDCLTCHDSTRQEVEDAITAGKAGTPVECMTCHGSGGAAAHHGGSEAKSGNCTHCHADPRENWYNDTPGDNGGSAQRPTQLACAECHVSFNNNNDISIRRTSSSSVRHSIPAIDAGYIYNYGMCFSCHDGNSAAAVDPYHGKPTSLPTNNRCTSSGAPGRGTFNLFWSQFNRAAYENDENCKNYENDYRYPANGYDYMIDIPMNNASVPVLASKPVPTGGGGSGGGGDWPPADSGTLTDVGNSYWDRSRSPDRLRVYVNVGNDGGTPKMMLDGSDSQVEYSCEYRGSGEYRCTVESDSLDTAGYDPYVVVFTGSNPGDGSVLVYTINDWGQSQDPLTP